MQNVSNHQVRLTILDDHSSEETVTWLKAQNVIFVPLAEEGYNHSNFVQYQLCRDSDADVVYAVEDDYLHSPTAIQEMLDSYEIFKYKLNGREIVIYPFDEPTEYSPPQHQAHIVHGSNRHWRTGMYTSCVLMATPQLFKDHWALFEVLALKYNGNYLQPRTEHYEEANTIWNIWREGHAVRFNPIPSLALHMQFDPQKDPYIDWKYWWDNYTL